MDRVLLCFLAGLAAGAQAECQIPGTVNLTEEEILNNTMNVFGCLLEHCEDIQTAAFLVAFPAIEAMVTDQQESNAIRYFLTCEMLLDPTLGLGLQCEEPISTLKIGPPLYTETIDMGGQLPPSAANITMNMLCPVRCGLCTSTIATTVTETTSTTTIAETNSTTTVRTTGATSGAAGRGDALVVATMIIGTLMATMIIGALWWWRSCIARHLMPRSVDSEVGGKDVV